MGTGLEAALDNAAGLGRAVGRGAIVGSNRWLRHQPAGARTRALATPGAALATVLVSRAPTADIAPVGWLIRGRATAARSEEERHG